jgi:hypothetical protein
VEKDLSPLPDRGRALVEGGNMPRQTRKILATATVAAAVLSAGVGPAPAQATSGHQSFHGFIVKTRGDVDMTRIAGHGAFDGVGRIVEVHSRPGDPNSVNRDNLVFRAGTMHLVSTNHKVTFHMNRRTCRVSATLYQTSRVTGGTRMFRGASGRFHARVRAFGIAPRAIDGSCRQSGELRHELDLVQAHGRLAY